MKSFTESPVVRRLEPTDSFPTENPASFDPATHEANFAPHPDDEVTLAYEPHNLPENGSVNLGGIAGDGQDSDLASEFDVITRISPPIPPPDASALPDLQSVGVRREEAESRTGQFQKPRPRRLRALLYLSLGVLVGFVTHEEPTVQPAKDGHKPSVTNDSPSAKAKPAPSSEVAKVEPPESKSELPPLPAEYDPKDANPTAAAQAFAIGDYPEALRHYHALSQTYPEAEVFKVIVSVLRKRIQTAAKAE